MSHARMGLEFARRTRRLLMIPGFNGLKLFSSRAAIKVHPQVGMVDEQLAIGASGLEPGQLVILRSSVNSECGKYSFQAHATYEADSLGRVRVSEQPSLGGTYSGLHPMGLLWGVVPDAKSAKKKARLVKTDPNMRHWVYTIDLFDGNVPNVNRGPREILASETAIRRFIAPYVEVHNVEGESFQGTLYLPKETVASSQLPLIIEMAGLAPRSGQERSQLLASHGFAVFDFNYFSAIGEALLTGAPRGRNAYLDCQLLFDIVEFARKHPRIDDTRIGISARCTGGSLALNAIPRLTGFPVRCMSVARCVDVIFYYLGIQTPDGSLIHPAPVTRENRYTGVTPGEDGSLWLEADFNHHFFHAGNHEDYVAPVENITIPTLFLVCGDDQLAPTEKCMIRAAERMRQAGNGHLVDFVHLPGAGHLLLPPYLPLCTESRIYVPDVTDAATYARWGGEPILHAEAQVKAWQKMLEFFRKHLGPVEPLRQDWVSIYAD